MLPFGAQGANQAIEDAGALGALFSGGESESDVASRLALFEQVRRLRASRVQTLSKVRLGKEREVEAELRQYADPPGSGTLRRFCFHVLLDYPFPVLKVIEVLSVLADLDFTSRCTDFIRRTLHA